MADKKNDFKITDKYYSYTDRHCDKFNNSKVYKLTNSNGLTYIGSTTKAFLDNELLSLRVQYDNFKKGKTKTKQTFFKIFDDESAGNVKITLLEKFKVKFIYDFHQKKRDWIDKMECINNKNHQKDNQICECGSVIIRKNMYSHKQTKAHKKWAVENESNINK